MSAGAKRWRTKADSSYAGQNATGCHTDSRTLTAGQAKLALQPLQRHKMDWVRGPSHGALQRALLVFRHRWAILPRGRKPRPGSQGRSLLHNIAPKPANQTSYLAAGGL